MRSYQIRLARESDLDEIMRVIGEAQRAIADLGIDQWQDGYPQREILRWDISLGRLYAADDGAGVCAVAALCPGDEPFYQKIDGAWQSAGPYLTVHRLATGDRARRAGAASALLSEAEALAKRENMISLRADTHRGNHVMRAFMEKRGFQYCGLVDYTPETKGDPLRAAYEKLLE